VCQREIAHPTSQAPDQCPPPLHFTQEVRILYLISSSAIKAHALNPFHLITDPIWKVRLTFKITEVKGRSYHRRSAPSTDHKKKTSGLSRGCGTGTPNSANSCAEQDLEKQRQSRPLKLGFPSLAKSNNLHNAPCVVLEVDQYLGVVF
jgi:hypothetical protein